MGQDAPSRPVSLIIADTNENYYEIAWNVRLQFIESLISEGETNLHRVIRKLESFERRYRLSVERGSYHALDQGSGGQEYLAEGFSGKAQWVRLESDERFDVLPTGIPSYWRSSHRGKPIAVPAYADYSCIPAKWIVDLCREEFDCIVELGSGLGRNLFEIYYNGGPAKTKYYACEISSSGRRLTETLAALAPELNIVTCTFDHRRPDFSFLEERGKVLFFTCHSIEQVDRIPANYFDLLADAADRVTCIHFEPFGFQISTTDEISKAQERYVRENNWNTNFLEVLNASGKTGKIKVAFMARDIFASDGNTPTSVALWHT